MGSSSTRRTVKSAAAFVALILCVSLAYVLGRSNGGRSGGRCSATVTLDDFKAGILKAGLFTGGPEDRFEDVGRQTLATSITVGLMPEHKVLDIGAGALRVGWWLVHYVDPSNYYAIEPARERIDTAARLLNMDINIRYNDDFKFPDVEFDFVLARSIWTHASKSMISKMLAEFAEHSTPEGKFLTSVLLARSEQEDYKGDAWVGKVLETDPSGVVKHSLGWIITECKRHGLSMQQVGDLHGQIWLLIARESK